MQCLDKPASKSLESGYHPGDLDYRFDVVVVPFGEVGSGIDGFVDG